MHRDLPGDQLFPLHEVGSLAKPRWRTKGISQPLNPGDLKEAEVWASRLEISNYHDLVKDVLREGPDQHHRKLLELSTIYGVRFFEKAGLDNDGVGGEQQRIEMYEHVIRQVSGMEFLGHVNSFDYKYFRKAVAKGPVTRRQQIYTREFSDVKRIAKRPVKVPITGPYTLLDWSYNDYYLGRGKSINLKERKINARREFLLDIVRNVLRPEIKDLVDLGASWIQIDEPALTTHPEPVEMEMFVEAWNETVKGFPCKFSDHTCYPSEVGYKLLATYAPELDHCSQLTLEFANRDPTVLGVNDQAREGYAVIKQFLENGYSGEFGVGAVHVHDYTGIASPGAGHVEGRNIIESPELVRDRLLYVSKLVGDPAKIWVNPDCGLRTRTWDVAFEKLTSLARGAELARKEWR